MWTSVRRTALSCVSAGSYLIVCRWWAGRGGPSAAWVAAAVWPILWVMVARIWRLRWSHALIVFLGAGLTCLAWSFQLVDFPPPWADNSPYGWLFVFAPFIGAFMIGAVLGDRGPIVSALAIGLATPALLPVCIWNSNKGVAGGWSLYPYPWLPMELVSLLVSVLLGLGAGYLGTRLRRCFRRVGAATTNANSDGDKLIETRP